MAVQGQILDITVVACERLLDKEIIGLMDPYVEIEYGNTKYRTRTCFNGGQDPAFGDRFHITLIEGVFEIKVSVWNSNKLRPRNFIGNCRIQLQRVITEGFDDRTWSLLTKSHRYAGDLKLTMQFDQALRSFHPPEMPPPAYQPTTSYQ